MLFATCCLLIASCYLIPITCSLLLAYFQLATCGLLPASCYLLLGTGFLLLATGFLLLFYFLLATYYFLLAHMLLATFSHAARCWGDLLRSIPCVTVWHWKTNFFVYWFLSKSFLQPFCIPFPNDKKPTGQAIT